MSGNQGRANYQQQPNIQQQQRFTNSPFNPGENFLPKPRQNI